MAVSWMDDGLSWLKKAEEDLVLAVEATNPDPEAGIVHGLNQDPGMNCNPYIIYNITYIVVGLDDLKCLNIRCEKYINFQI